MTKNSRKNIILNKHIKNQFINKSIKVSTLVLLSSICTLNGYRNVEAEPSVTATATANTTATVSSTVTATTTGTVASPSTDTYSFNTQNIVIDQFGYRPEDEKVAIIISPQAGFNKNNIFTPGAVYEVQDAITGKTVYSGPITSWKQGSTDPLSGDKTWSFDFSSVTTPGSYQIYDTVQKNKSFKFKIDNNVYSDVLRVAVKMFYYQRSGVAKQYPNAEAGWMDGASFVGKNQDKEARFIKDKDDASLARDVSGGWADGGDSNKYVTSALSPVNHLLTAYTENTEPWTDDFNIPESNNGIPDILDEVNYELQWIAKMQDSKDGAVYIKVGTLDDKYADKPGNDTRPRYYGEKCSSSTIVAANLFAHAALVFQNIPSLKNSCEDYKKRAIQAWESYMSSPKSDSCDNQEIKSADADLSLKVQTGTAVGAAVYLSALTNDSVYTDFISNNLGNTESFNEDSWSKYLSDQGEALLFYTKLPNADAGILNRIKARFSLTVNNPIAYGMYDGDPYRSYMTESDYVWGSNKIKAEGGNENYDAFLYSSETSSKKLSFLDRSLSQLHYLHGVNPLGIVYLTNMNKYGASFSANEMAHEWFGAGDFKNAITSKFGPASGFMTAGPNKKYSGSATPPAGQPPMKAYFDSSNPAQKAWEITGPAVKYQGAYIKLLSKFVKKSKPLPIPTPMPTPTPTMTPTLVATMTPTSVPVTPTAVVTPTVVTTPTVVMTPTSEVSPTKKPHQGGLSIEEIKNAIANLNNSVTKLIITYLLQIISNIIQYQTHQAQLASANLDSERRFSKSGQRGASSGAWFIESRTNVLDGYNKLSSTKKSLAKKLISMGLITKKTYRELNKDSSIRNTRKALISRSINPGVAKAQIRLDTARSILTLRKIQAKLKKLNVK